MKLNVRIILEALWYALEQAYSSEISITRNIMTDKDALLQVKEIVEQLEAFSDSVNMREDLILMAQWSNDNLFYAVKEAETWDDVAILYDAANFYEAAENTFHTEDIADIDIEELTD